MEEIEPWPLMLLYLGRGVGIIAVIWAALGWMNPGDNSGDEQKGLKKLDTEKIVEVCYMINNTGRFPARLPV